MRTQVGQIFYQRTRHHPRDFVLWAEHMKCRGYRQQQRKDHEHQQGQDKDSPVRFPLQTGDSFIDIRVQQQLAERMTDELKQNRGNEKRSKDIQAKRSYLFEKFVLGTGGRYS